MRTDALAPAASLTDRPPLTGLPLTLLLSAMTALTALGIDMSLPAMPQLQRAFSADVAHVQLTLSLFLVGYGLGQFVWGSLSDHYGRRPLLLGGIAVFTLTSFACTTAHSLTALVILRLIQGIGASVGPILGRAIVRDLFNPKVAAGVLSHITQVMVLAPILAPTLGGYLLLWFGWQSIFFVFTLAGLIVGLVCWRRLPETLAHRHDDIGVFRQTVQGYRKVLTHRESFRYVLGGSFSYAGLFAYISGAPFVLMEVFGVSQRHFGYYFALPAVSLMFGATANRILLRRLSSPALLRLGALLLLAAGLVAAALSWLGMGGVAGVLGPLMVYLFGIGLLAPNATALALASHGKTAGAASSLMGGLQTVAGAVSGSIVGAFYNHTSHSLAFTLGAQAVLTFLVCGWQKPPKAAEGEAH